MAGKDKIREEAERVQEAAKYSSQGQFEQAKIWNKRSLCIGVPASGLAAIAGVAGLATTVGRIPAALMSLIAAFLSASMTTLNYSRKIDQAHSSANSYLALQQDARIFIKVDLPVTNESEARELLAKLVARQQEINSTAPIPSEKARKRAKANIDGGGQTYAIDSSKKSKNGSSK